MSISVPDILKHIRDEARFLDASTAPVAEAAFLADEVLKRACVRAIEIIGEAAKKVPEISGKNTRRWNGARWRA